MYANIYAAPRHPLVTNAKKSSKQGSALMQVKIPNTNNQDLAALSFSIQKLSICADM